MTKKEILSHAAASSYSKKIPADSAMVKFFCDPCIENREIGMPPGTRLEQDIGVQAEDHARRSWHRTSAMMSGNRSHFPMLLSSSGSFEISRQSPVTRPAEDGYLGCVAAVWGDTVGKMGTRAVTQVVTLFSLARTATTRPTSDASKGRVAATEGVADG